MLAGPLKSGNVTATHLAAVQQRRSLPMRVIQWGQVQVQNGVLGPLLAGTKRPSLPWPLKLLRWFPLLQRIPARLIGMGIRPEHVRTLLAD
jgi:hypothetical protein